MPMKAWESTSGDIKTSSAKNVSFVRRLTRGGVAQCSDEPTLS